MRPPQHANSDDRTGESPPLRIGDRFNPYKQLLVLMVPMSLAANNEISLSASLLYGALVFCASRKHSTFATVKGLSTLLNWSESRVERGLKELVNLGLVLRKRGGDGRPSCTEFIWSELLSGSLKDMAAADPSFVTDLPKIRPVKNKPQTRQKHRADKADLTDALKEEENLEENLRDSPLHEDEASDRLAPQSDTEAEADQPPEWWTPVDVEDGRATLAGILPNRQLPPSGLVRRIFTGLHHRDDFENFIKDAQERGVRPRGAGLFVTLRDEWNRSRRTEFLEQQKLLAIKRAAEASTSARRLAERAAAEAETAELEKQKHHSDEERRRRIEGLSGQELRSRERELLTQAPQSSVGLGAIASELQIIRGAPGYSDPPTAAEVALKRQVQVSELTRELSFQVGQATRGATALRAFARRRCFEVRAQLLELGVDADGHIPKLSEALAVDSGSESPQSRDFETRSGRLESAAASAKHLASAFLGGD